MYFRFINLSSILLELLSIELILHNSELFVLRIYYFFFFEIIPFVTLKKFLCDYYFFKNSDLYLIFVKNLSPL